MKSRSISIEKGEELQKILQEEKPGPLRERLLFLKCVQDNFDDVKFACQTFQIGYSTGYEWIAKWNHLGIEGLKDHAIPGRPKTLGEKELDILKNHLEGRIWQTTEVRDLIKQLFNVEWTTRWVSHILKKHLKCHYAKPYRLPSKRPDNAEEMLEKSLKEVFKTLDSYGIKAEEVAIGYVDEASPQNKANSGRGWCLQKPVMQQSSEKIKVSTIGFYALQGQSCVDFILDSKERSIIEFLQEIRQANEEFEYIIVILDNLKSHHTSAVEKAAFDLGIFLVFLPPYSPDLNPVEFIWKTLKRILSFYFIDSEKVLRELIFGIYTLASDSLSYAKTWISKFLPRDYQQAIWKNAI
jgi:transposase